MNDVNLEAPARLALACALLLLGALALAAVPQADGRTEANTAFRDAAAGVYGRLQHLPDLEKRMLAATEPQKAAFYAQKRDEARRRIDELLLEAEAAAASDAERARLAGLAAFAGQADARAEQLRATIAVARRSAPLAELHD